MQEDLDELMGTVQRLKAQSQFTLQQLVAQQRIGAGKNDHLDGVPGVGKVMATGRAHALVHGKGGST